MGLKVLTPQQPGHFSVDQLSPSRSHLISINPGVVERELLQITRAALLAPIAQEISKVLVARD